MSSAKDLESGSGDDSGSGKAPSYLAPVGSGLPPKALKQSLSRAFLSSGLQVTFKVRAALLQRNGWAG